MVLASTAMNAFEGLAVATVLPDIATDLGRVDLIGWVVTAYLIPSAVIGVAAGSLVDSVGARRTYRLGVAGFIVGSVASALAPTLFTLIAVRAIQGASSGMVISAGLSSIGIALPERLRGRALAAASTVWGVLGIGSPAIGALINQFSGWRSVFWVIVPIAVVAGAAGWNSAPTAVRSAKDDGGRAAFDWTGLALLAIFTTSVILGLSKVALSSVPVLMGAVGVAAMLLWWVGRARAPLFVGSEVLGGRYLLPNLAPFGAMAAVPGFNSFIALYARISGNQQGLWAAIGILGVTLGWTIGANVASRALDSRPERSVIAAGYGLMISGLIVVALSATRVWLPVVYGGLFIAGLGVGTTTNASFLLLQRIAPESSMGRASSMHQYLRAVGVTIGVAVLGAVIFATVEARAGTTEQLRDALAGPEGSDGSEVLIDEVAADALAGGMSFAALSGVVVLVAIAGVLRFRERAY